MADTLAIAFQGAARTVTGSRHLLRFGSRSWLFDCGLFQGHRDEAERLNRTFRFEPAGLDAAVISHAHLDHVGNLPTLVARGFGGRIHATAATADLAGVLLRDSAFLIERDVEHVNRHRPGPPRVPLYTTADVETTLPRFAPHAYHEPWDLFPGVRVGYHDAGHILGSALTVFELGGPGAGFRLAMSGDLGRAHRRILRDPETFPAVDALVLESTYGDRLHPPQAETERGLTEVVTRTLARGGRLIVPAFAVGRTQELVATLHDLTGRGDIPTTPIFVDSPLAREATGIYVRHPECFDAETAAQFRNHDGPGTPGEPFGFARLRYVGSAEESRALNDRKEPCIIIAASGMAEGGRILHHLQHGLGDARNTVLFVGFQSEGTLGRRLRDGAERVNIFGEPVQRRAEIAGLDGFSAHADQAELIGWVRRLNSAPKRIFLVHGEAAPADVLAAKLRAAVGSDVHVPAPGEEVTLWN
jgi:metallo-beta-lactamase family protein